MKMWYKYHKLFIREVLKINTKTKVFINEETLKNIALITMIIDHIGVVFVNENSPMYIIMRTIGRISAPIFCWFLVKGFHRTHNLKRYTMRILIFAILSFYPYMLVFGGSLNMLFLFFFGLIFLQAVHRQENQLLKAVEIVIAVVGCYFSSYGLFGLLMIISMDIMRKSKYYAVNIFVFSVLLYYLLILKSLSYVFVFLSVGSLIPFILVSLPTKTTEKPPSLPQKYFFYLFYPLHLLFLFFFRFFLCFFFLASLDISEKDFSNFVFFS